MLSGIGGIAHPLAAMLFFVFYWAFFRRNRATNIKSDVVERIGRLMSSGVFVIYNKAVAIVFVKSGLGLIVRVLLA